MSCRTQSSSAEQYCRLGHTYQFYCFASATFSICVRAVGRSLLVSCVIIRLTALRSQKVGASLLGRWLRRQISKEAGADAKR